MMGSGKKRRRCNDNSGRKGGWDLEQREILEVTESL